MSSGVPFGKSNRLSTPKTNLLIVTSSQLIFRKQNIWFRIRKMIQTNRKLLKIKSHINNKKLFLYIIMSEITTQEWVRSSIAKVIDWHFIWDLVHSLNEENFCEIQVKSYELRLSESQTQSLESEPHLRPNVEAIGEPEALLASGHRRLATDRPLRWTEGTNKRVDTYRSRGPRLRALNTSCLHSTYAKQKRKFDWC